MAVWQIDVTGSCSRTIEVIADDEEQASEIACSEFVRLWKAQPDQNFGLFEMDIWEATNATES